MSSTGLMSGRKQGLPHSPREKHPQFDGTLEGSKLSYFTAVHAGSLGYALIWFPWGFTSSRSGLWKSFPLNVRSDKSDTSLWNVSWVRPSVISHVYSPSITKLLCYAVSLLKYLCNYTTGACCHAYSKRICFFDAFQSCYESKGMPLVLLNSSSPVFAEESRIPKARPWQLHI